MKREYKNVQDLKNKFEKEYYDKHGETSVCTTLKTPIGINQKKLKFSFENENAYDSVANFVEYNQKKDQLTGNIPIDDEIKYDQKKPTKIDLFTAVSLFTGLKINGGRFTGKPLDYQIGLIAKEGIYLRQLCRCHIKGTVKSAYSDLDFYSRDYDNLILVYDIDKEIQSFSCKNIDNCSQFPDEEKNNSTIFNFLFIALVNK